MGTPLTRQPGPISFTTAQASTAPFWDGCAQGELRFVRCGVCGAADFPPAVRCRRCLSRELGWERSAGLGTVYSWTVVWRPVTPQFRTPYAPAIVDLDEGYRMLTNLVDLDVEDIDVGLRVQVTFQPTADGVTLPYFAPVRD